MAWVKTADERRCGNCGAGEERWALHHDHGHRVAEATFCPVCYPDLEKIFHTPEAARDAGRTISELETRSEAEGVKIPVVL